MASNLWNLGALTSGLIEGKNAYEDRQMKRQAQQSQIDFEKLRYQQAQEEMARNQELQARQPQMARGQLALLSQTPQQGPIPPAPGQASVPMQQPPQYQSPPPQGGSDPFSAADQAYGFPPGTLRALAKTESNGNPQAVSPKGAQGIFQIMPQTQQNPGFGLPPLNPNDPMSAGAYLAKMRQLSGGDMNMALAKYNAGPAGNPNNPETIGYIRKFQANMGGQQQPPQQPQIPPYRTMAGGSQQQQQQPTQIPPPPPMDFQSAIRVLAEKGITDPETVIAILDKNQARLNSQAQVQLAQIKEQELERYHQGMVGAAQQRADTGQQNADTNVAKYQAQSALAQRKLDLLEKRTNNPDAKLSPEDVKFMASQALAGDKSVYQNLGRGAQGAENIIALRREVKNQAQAQGMSGAELATINAEFEGLKSGERALGTRTANVGMAVNEAKLLSGLARTASAEWERTGIKSLNDLEKYAQGKTASPTLRNFVAANNSFINAYARAISPSGVPTVSDKDHAREMLEVGFSKGDYNAVLDQLQKEMEAAQQSPQQTKEDLRNLARSGNAGAAPASSPAGIPSGWSVKEH